MLPVSYESKKMNEVDLKNILLCAVLNGWAKKYYLQGWFFKIKTYKDTCDMFERMEFSEQVCERVEPFKTLNWSDVNFNGHSRYKNVGEAVFPSNPDKGCAVKRKKINAGNHKDQPSKEKYAWYMSPYIPRVSVKFWWITLENVPLSGPTRNPTLVVKKNVVNRLILTKTLRR